MTHQRIHEVDYRPGSRIGVLALHADIEGGTGELAEFVAAETGASLLIFKQPSPEPKRISSLNFDQSVYPELRSFIDSVDFVLSLHGHARGDELEYAIFLGGGRRRAANQIACALQREAPDYLVIDDLELIPPLLRGLSPDNPVNAPKQGGVQVELSIRARGCQPLGSPNDPAVPELEIVAGLVSGVRAVEQCLTLDLAR